MKLTVASGEASLHEIFLCGFLQCPNTSTVPQLIVDAKYGNKTSCGTRQRVRKGSLVVNGLKKTANRFVNSLRLRESKALCTLDLITMPNIGTKNRNQVFRICERSEKALYRR